MNVLSVIDRGKSGVMAEMEHFIRGSESSLNGRSLAQLSVMEDGQLTVRT